MKEVWLYITIFLALSRVPSLFCVKCALALSSVHHCLFTETAEFKLGYAVEKHSPVLSTELINMPVSAQGS